MGRLTEVFIGRDTRYFDLFDESARTAVVAAELLQRFIDGIPDEAALAKEIGAVESEADRITHDIIQHAGATFVTPLEREDILELASALDDVIDYIDETADLIVLYKVEAPMEEAIQLCAILVEATRALSQAMPRLRSFGDVRHYTVEVNRLENEGDRLSRQAIAGLFDGGIDPMIVIRWKDIFERLEQAIDATEKVANILEGIIIKNR
jgi:predicted phosphate transport protein (TIGR00153 family)